MASSRKGVPRLAALGLTAESEQLYRVVLRHPDSSAADLSGTSGRSIAEVKRQLDPLLERGLVSVTEGVVTPHPPESALGALIRNEAERLAKAERALTTAQAETTACVNEYHAGRRADWVSISIDVVPGDQLAEVMSTLIRHSEGELLFLRPDQWLLPPGQRSDTAVTSALRAGRTSRALYPVDVARSHPPQVLDRVRAGERIRMLPTLPTRLAVFGSEALLIPATWGSFASTPLLVRQPALVAASTALFDQLWSSAVSVPGYDDGEHTDAERDLLTLLAKGAKDDQIARALGVSVRTVRRWVATVMADLDANSRFQAGVEAARNGWL
jgi:DNA-binding CsgD family transcriptional regulator